MKSPRTADRISFLVLLTLAAITGCNKSTEGGETDALPPCADGNKVFSALPVPLGQVRGWEPLGHMGPPAHTFPTDHQYLYLRNADSTVNTPLSVPLYAPANIRITSIFVTTYAVNGVTDYSIFYQPCGDLKGRFGHVGSLSPALAAAAGPLDQACSSYQPNPGFTVTGCQSRAFRYDAVAGEQIGTAGDGGSIALDWWLQDRRIAKLHFTSPARFSPSSWGDGFDAAHTVPASAYFKDSLAVLVASKIGRYDGGQLRVDAPVGGTIEVDVDSTARGYWFNPAQPYPSEAYHAALAPDYLSPHDTQAFSIGLSQPNGTSFYGTFAIRDTGRVNRPFETVRADGKIYCYESAAGLVLLRLMDPATLRLDIRGVGTCAALEPYGFGTNVFDYKR